MTAGELHVRLMDICASLTVEALARLGINCLTFTQQATAGVTYAKKIDKSETRVDWTLPADEVHNHIRALSPFPGAWCEAEIGGRKERLKLLRSAVAEGAVVERCVQRVSRCSVCLPHFGQNLFIARRSGLFRRFFLVM